MIFNAIQDFFDHILDGIDGSEEQPKYLTMRLVLVVLIAGFLPGIGLFTIEAITQLNANQPRLNIAITYVIFWVAFILLIQLYRANEKISHTWVKIVFIVVMFIVVLFGDDITQVFDGRSQYLFFVPILLASFLLKPHASFIVATCASILRVIAILMLDKPHPFLAITFGVVAFYTFALLTSFLAEVLQRTRTRLHETIGALLLSQQQLIVSKENERAKLSRDLHDQPIQDLLGLTIQLRMSGKHSEAELVQNVIRTLRQICGDLRPQTIAQFGFEAAVQSHVQRQIESQPEPKIHLNLMQDKQILPEQMRIALFRIYEQTLNNIYRHAQADTIHINFSFDEAKAYLQIIDDGVGFDPPKSIYAYAQQNHFGLIGCHEHSASVNGLYEITSKKGAGTIVEATIPVIHTNHLSDGEYSK